MGQFVHAGFDRPGDLRVAVPAHRLAVGVVGVDDLRVESDIGDLVQRGGRHQHHVRVGGAPRGVCAVVLGHLDIAEREAALRVASLADSERGGLARRQVGELVVSVVDDLDGAAGLPGEENGDVLVAVGVQARPECATDGRHNDSGVLTLQAQRFQGTVEVALREEWDLGLGGDREVAGAVEFGDAAGCSHTGLLDAGHRVKTFGDVGRSSDCLFDVSG